MGRTIQVRKKRGGKRNTQHLTDKCTASAILAPTRTLRAQSWVTQQCARKDGGLQITSLAFQKSSQMTNEKRGTPPTVRHVAASWNRHVYHVR
jgi:hypothetical protein